jgi:hypothetical protein
MPCVSIVCLLACLFAASGVQAADTYLCVADNDHRL